MAIDKTREKILDVADKLFGKFGFHKTSMDEIAKISRKAKGSLYYHFSSKEELFKEVVSNEIINFKKQLSEIVNNKKEKPSNRIKKFLITRMKLLNDAANYHDTLRADFFEHYHFIDDLRAAHDEWEKTMLKQLVLEGVENGEFVVNTDLDTTLDVILMTVKGLEIPFFLQEKYEKYHTNFEYLVEVYVDAFKK